MSNPTPAPVALPAGRVPVSTHPYFGLPVRARIPMPGDTRDLLIAQLSVITEVRGRLSQCASVDDVRRLLASMADERKPEVVRLDALEAERLEDMR